MVAEHKFPYPKVEIEPRQTIKVQHCWAGIYLSSMELM